MTALDVYLLALLASLTWMVLAVLVCVCWFRLARCIDQRDPDTHAAMTANERN